MHPLSLVKNPYFWAFILILGGAVWLFRKTIFLSFIYFIGFRYLKKRFTSYVAVAGVTVGIMVLVVVLSVMGGFQRTFWQRLRASSGDLTIESGTYFGIYDSDKIEEELHKVDGVVRTAPFVRTIILVESIGVDYGFLKGVNLDKEKKMGKFAKFLLPPRKAYMKLAGYKKPPSTGQISQAFQKLSAVLAEHSIKVSEKKLPDDFPLEWPGQSVRPFQVYWKLVRDKEYIESLPTTIDLKKKTASGLPGAIVGYQMMKRFGLNVGSTMTLTSVSGLALDGMASFRKKKIKTREQDFEVVGAIKVGIYTQDRRAVYTSISAAQKFIGIEGRVSGINIEASDFTRAKALKKQVRERLDQTGLGEDLYVRTWKEKNRSLFQAVQMEKMLLTILLSFIVLVAGFMIFSILSMMVVEKTKDVGIIKALGSPSQGVMSIFLFQGMLIGILGIIIGLTLGLLLSYNINEVADGVKALTGFHPFPPKIYYLDRIPISVDFKGIFLICTATFGVSFFFALYPAYRASKFHAIQALHYE